MTGESPRDLYLKCVSFDPTGRILFRRLTWLMPGIKEDWMAEGVSAQEIEAALERCDPEPEMITINTGAFPPFSRDVLEETDGYTITVGAKGGKAKLQKGYYGYAAMPFEYPVRSAEHWECLRPRFQWVPERLSPGWAEQARAQQAQGLPIWLHLDGFYWFIRELMGDEAACLAFYDRPALVHDISQTLCQLMLDTASALAGAGVVPDCIHFPEDIAGKGGPIISPRQFRELFSPYWRMALDRFRSLGVPHLEVDSDGRIDELIPLYLDVGVNGLMPFECQAGMDIVEVRRTYSRSLIIGGGIDKLALVGGRAAIDRELASKLPPMIKAGGYMIMTDHRMIRGCPFSDWVYYTDQVWRYLAG